MKKPESICVFGDSTAWGAWDLEKGGWVSRLWLDIGKRDEEYVEIYNQSISGGTTETILKRFESEAKIRNADALIFQTGGNDSAYEHTPENHLVLIEKFESNIQEIITRAKKLTQNVIFVGFKNCDETKTMPVPWEDIYYTNENIQKYNVIMKKLCDKNNIPFLDLWGLLNNSDLSDGVHPNATGHQKIFEKVKDFLIEHNWI
jgi:lysophospholipase L1-like esterase